MTDPILSGLTVPRKKAAAPERLLYAALRSFADVGYHATTTRHIAERAGMSPSAVYVHYKSKVDLLHELSKIGHESARLCLENALAEPGTPRERLANAVRAFAQWHAENQTIARVVQYEYEALPKAYRSDIKAVRRQLQVDVEEEIRRGEAAGEFATDDVPGTALAIVSLCVDIARWFNPKSGRSPEELGNLYASLALRMLGCIEVDESTAPRRRGKRATPSVAG